MGHSPPTSTERGRTRGRAKAPLQPAEGRGAAPLTTALALSRLAQARATSREKRGHSEEVGQALATSLPPSRS